MLQTPLAILKSSTLSLDSNAFLNPSQRGIQHSHTLERMRPDSVAKSHEMLSGA
jgi:hypothetical protein